MRGCDARGAGREMNDARVFERFARGKKKKNTATSRAQNLGRRSGEDQLKLASLSSGVEVALVVSASINWGKRCPHFLAETRPPFFATIRAFLPNVLSRVDGRGGSSSLSIRSISR